MTRPAPKSLLTCSQVGLSPSNETSQQKVPLTDGVTCKSLQVIGDKRSFVDFVIEHPIKITLPNKNTIKCRYIRRSHFGLGRCGMQMEIFLLWSGVDGQTGIPTITRCSNGMVCIQSPGVPKNVLIHALLRANTSTTRTGTTYLSCSTLWNAIFIYLCCCSAQAICALNVRSETSVRYTIHASHSPHARVAWAVA